VYLYVHVPFCARRCSYCDFAIAVRRRIPTDDFVDDILGEWDAWQPHPIWSESQLIDTMYFGGGTPSLLEPAAIARLLSRFRTDRRFADDVEITLEANPDDVTSAAADAWAAAGINRVSLGAQSFDPRVLDWMHRTHTASQVPVALEVLRAAGIGNLSIDLIFGLPAELEREWELDLQQALALMPAHLSLYGLTVEPHTPLARWTASGHVQPVNEERYAAEFLGAHQALTAAGYEHYEVSNAARPGCRARHNTAYWTGAPFIGLGPSAHSGFGGTRQWNVREWQAYHQASLAGRSLVAGSETLEPTQQAIEEIYLGLRTARGLPAGRLHGDVERQWITSGWAHLDSNRLQLTPEGWLRLDALAASVS
jgi:oxygen-independent coproporphyrinogen III oxidase